MKLLKKIQSAFQPKPIHIPEFPNGETKRIQVRFYGMVQGVGFRYEMYAMATTLHLGGWVKNEYDGSVLSQIQGTKERIDYLLSHMKSIPRIHIDSMDIQEIDIQDAQPFYMAN